MTCQDTQCGLQKQVEIEMKILDYLSAVCVIVFFAIMITLTVVAGMQHAKSVVAEKLIIVGVLVLFTGIIAFASSNILRRH